MSISTHHPSSARSTQPKKNPAGKTTPIEVLEARCVLAAPQLLVAFDQVIQLRAGTALHIPLNALDPEGDAITYSVSVDNSSFEAAVPGGNRSVIFRLSHESSGLSGDVSFTDEIMTVELLEDIAPETAGRFAGLVDLDAYNGLTFHRLVNNFAAQFGDPDGVGTGGSGVTIDDEFSKYSRHTTPFLLSTAKSLDDTFDMQAFLTQGGANSTRNLDFNHTVFGVVTSFSSDISFNVPVTRNPVTGENSFPVSPITISDASVYIDDQNGVLRLYVPDNIPVGTMANVTLTLTDVNGETSTSTIMVEVAADVFDDQPFFEPDPEPQTTDFNVPFSFTLQATDIENNPIEFLEGSATDYAQRGLAKNPNLQVSVDPNTGVVTVTPNELVAGTFAVLVKVRQVGGSAEDFQVVPVNVRVPAPAGGVVLLTDTGTQGDGITSVNNSGGQPLEFRVDGGFEGASVQLLIDGTVVQEDTIPASGSVTFTLDGSTPLTEGAHTITARHVATGSVAFGNFDPFVIPGMETEPLAIIIDSQPLVFISSPVTAATTTVPYTYNVATDGEGLPGTKYELQSAPTGMTINSTTGLIQWTPSLAQGGNNPVSVLATDAAGNTAVQSFTIFANTVPVFLEVGNKSVDEGTLLEVQLMVDDPDDGETFSFELIGNVPVGAAIDNSGKFTFTPTEAQGPNTFNVSVRVTDSRGATDETTLSVQVNEVLQPPVITPVADQFVLVGGTVSLNIIAVDPDIPQQSHTFSLDPGAPEGASIDPVTGLFTYTSPDDQPLGTLTVTVRVTEGAGANELSSTTTFNINVVENLPPIFPDQPSDFTTKASVPLSFDVVAVDPDAVPANLIFSLEPGTPDFVAIDATTGRVTVTTTRETPPQSIEIVVRVTEDSAAQLSATKVFTVEITDPPNLPPVFPDQPMSFSTQASVPLVFDVTATDPDEEPVPLVYSLEPGTPNFVTIDPSTGQVTVTTTRQTAPQTLQIVVRVTEDSVDALFATKTFSVEITTPPNLPPAFPTQPTEFTTEVGDPLTFGALAVDPEQVALFYSLEPGTPGIVSIDSATGVVTVNSSTSTLPQTIKFVVRATEPGPAGLSATQEFTVNLVPVSNQSPIINPTVRQAVRQGLQVKFNVDAFDPDSPASPLVYSLGPDAPPEASIDPLTGEVTFAAKQNTSVGVYRFGVQVAENTAGGLSATSNIEVQVSPLGIRDLIGIGNTRFGPDPSGLVPSTTQVLSSTSLAGFFSSTTTTADSSPGRISLTRITPDSFPGRPFNNISYGVDTGVGQSYTKDGEEGEGEQGENLQGDELPNEENSQENTGVVPAQATEPVDESKDDEKTRSEAPSEEEDKTPKAAMWDDRLIDWATSEHWTPGHETFARTMNASVNRMRGAHHSSDPYDIDLEPLVAPRMTVGAKPEGVGRQTPQFETSRGTSSTLVLPAPGSETVDTAPTQETRPPEESHVSDEIATMAAAGMAFYMPMLVTDLPEAKQSRGRWRKWLGNGGVG